MILRNILNNVFLLLHVKLYITYSQATITHYYIRFTVVQCLTMDRYNIEEKQNLFHQDFIWRLALNKLPTMQNLS